MLAVGPPPAYDDHQPAPMIPGPMKTRSSSSGSGFSMTSLVAPLVPVGRGVTEHACLLINVMMLSVLTGIVAAFLVRAYR